MPLIIHRWHTVVRSHLLKRAERRTAAWWFRSLLRHIDGMATLPIPWHFSVTSALTRLYAIFCPHFQTVTSFSSFHEVQLSSRCYKDPLFIHFAFHRGAISGHISGSEGGVLTLRFDLRYLFSGMRSRIGWVVEVTSAAMPAAMRRWKVV